MWKSIRRVVVAAANLDTPQCDQCGKTWGWCPHTNPQAIAELERKREQDQRELGNLKDA